MVRSPLEDRPADQRDARAWRRCYGGHAILFALMAPAYAALGMLAGSEPTQYISTAAFFACFAVLAAMSRARRSKLVASGWVALLVLFVLPQVHDVGRRLAWSTAHHLVATLVVAGLAILALLAIALVDLET